MLSAVLMDLSMTPVTIQAFLPLSVSVFKPVNCVSFTLQENRSNQFVERTQHSGFRGGACCARQDVLRLIVSVFACEVIQLRWSEVFSCTLWTLGSVRRTRTQRHCCKSLWSFSFHLSWKVFLFNRQQTFSPCYCSLTSQTAHALSEPLQLSGIKQVLTVFIFPSLCERQGEY